MRRKIFASILILVWILTLCACDFSDYKKASQLMEQGSFAEAREILSGMGDYKDSAELTKECDYQLAAAAYEEERYQEAMDGFLALGEYKDSATRKALAEDDLIRQRIVGKWITAEIDVSKSLQQSMENVDEETKEIFDNFNFEGLTLRSEVEFTADGTYVETVNRESADQFIQKFQKTMHDGMLAALEQELTAAAQEYGMTYEDLLRESGASDTSEIFTAQTGMSVEEFLDMAYGEMLETFLTAYAQNGSYTVKDGIITEFFGKEDKAICVLRLDEDVFVVTPEGMPAEAADQFPMEYTRFTEEA